MNNKPAYLSKDGLEQIRHELEGLVNVRRAEIAARIHEAKEHGDITENAEYEDAKNEQAFVEGRIQALSALVKNARAASVRRAPAWRAAIQPARPAASAGRFRTSA